MTRRVAVAVAMLAVLGVVLVLLIRRPRPAPLPQIVVMGVPRQEGCLTCHANVEGVGGAHAPFGCSPCHLGDPTARDATLAHRGLERQAGDFATVDRTCGVCHAVETARVRTSLMARAPGILAVDRFAFGERKTPFRDPSDDLTALDPNGAPKSPAESHVRKLCAGCHLGARKPRPGDLGEEARGGGCTACHLASPRPTGSGPLHPEVSAQVPERRCAGCHGRSGRIALSFHGLVELEPGDPRVTGKTADGRPLGQLAADVHAKGGLTCIDCHTERELMGTGAAHLHAHEALEVRCADCHAKAEKAAPIDPYREQVAEALRRSWARRGLPALSTTPLRTLGGTPLVRSDTATHSLLLATTGARKPIPLASPGAFHGLSAHGRLSCQACHSAWAPRCGACHTSFDAKGDDVDHLSGKVTAGRWLERAGANGFGLPLLALGPRGTIEPFVEGMRATFVTSSEVSRVLFAPLDPHTTGKARSCASCHVDASAYPLTGEVTRLGARLLDAVERARIARVGTCLPCHAGYDDRVYVDFPASLVRRTPRCTVK
ncbi:MAG: hypothetical protein JNL79_38060 [Myxococcales bacterium]|nr:hypothetical protein [Myxococcales bacterium]